MKKIFWRILIWFCLGSLWAADEGVAGPWRLSGGVGKVHDTPLGAVYRFDPGKLYFIPKEGENRLLKDRDYGMGGLLSISLLPNNKQPKRIVVIDFVIRVYPVFSKEGDPNFEFVLVRSENSEMQNDYRTLNGSLMVHNSGAFWSCAYRSVDSVYLFYRNNPMFRPDFEPLAMRVIFDTVTEDVLVSFNGQNDVITTKASIKNWPGFDIDIGGGILNQGGDGKTGVRKYQTNVRSLGITCMSDKSVAKAQYLEISSPVVRLYDTLKETEELKVRLFSPYPYGQYLPKTKKPINGAQELIRLARGDKNSEVQYAAALKLLYGGEDYCYPAEAVKLLEKAARDGHVLALYQLGVCHYRGYGVAVDTKKALSCLRDAAAFNYQNAEALEWFIEWDTAQRPFFMNKEFVEKYDRIREKNKSQPEHDLRHLMGVVHTGFGKFVPYSLKDGILAEYISRWVNKDEKAQPKYFIDHAINTGYAPANAAKARHFPGLDNAQKIQLLKTGVEGGDTAAVPELLLALARSNQLSADEFTVERDLIFADHALYQFLAHAVKNPAEPGVKAYLAGDRTKAKTLLEASNSKDKHLLLGLLMLINKLPRWTELDNNLSEDAEEAIIYLNRAAVAGEPVAQYILAALYFRKDIPWVMGKKATLPPAEEMLENAVKSGHLGAALLMARIKLNDNDNVQAMKYLEKPCEANYGPAFYLKGKVLQKGGRKQEADQAFQKAVELGDYRGLQVLALSARNPKQEQNLWHKYIQADLQARALDRYDPYFPRLYQDLYKWKRVEPAAPSNKNVYVDELESWLNRKNEEFKNYQRKRK